MEEITVTPGHLGSGDTESARATRLLGYPTVGLSRTDGPGRSARHGADASQFGGWHTAKYLASGGRQPG